MGTICDKQIAHYEMLHRVSDGFFEMIKAKEKDMRLGVH
jgi:hypothetical protein